MDLDWRPEPPSLRGLEFWFYRCSIYVSVDIPIDLRHNYSSRAVSTGHTLPTAAKQMGHSQIATTARCVNAMPRPVQEMNASVGEQISEALGGTSGSKDPRAKPKS